MRCAEQPLYHVLNQTTSREAHMISVFFQRDWLFLIGIPQMDGDIPHFLCFSIIPYKHQPTGQQDFWTLLIWFEKSTFAILLRFRKNYTEDHDRQWIYLLFVVSLPVPMDPGVLILSQTILSRSQFFPFFASFKRHGILSFFPQLIQYVAIIIAISAATICNQIMWCTV